MSRTLIAILALTAPLCALADDPAPAPNRGDASAADGSSLTERLQRSRETATARALAVSWGGLYGGYVGGTTGYLAGEAMESLEQGHTSEGILPGVLVGATAGSVTTALLANQLPGTPDGALFLSSGSGMGAWYGTQLGRTLLPPDADGAQERVHAAALAGSMAGTGYAFLGNAPTIGHQLHFAVATGVGSIVGTGIADAAQVHNRRWSYDNGKIKANRQLRAGINLSGMALFGGAASLFNRTGAATPNVGAITLGLGHGAWAGAWAPYLFSNKPTDRQVTGGLRAGLGLGYATSLGIAAIDNPSATSTTLQAVGAAAGTALGAGIPLAAGEGLGAKVVAPMLASGAAGQVFGAAIAPNYTLDANDAVLLGTLGAWTGYQTAGWAAWASTTGQEPTQAAGVALTTGGAGTLLAMGLAPVVDVSPAGSAMLFSGGGWGTWYGGWSANLAGMNADDGWLVMLGAGDGALVGTAVAQAAGWDPTWRQVGLVNGMGLLGAAGGGLVGVIGLYDEDNWNPMVGSILAGSTVGLGTGIYLAAKGPKEGAAGLPELRLGRNRYQPSVSAKPWTDDEGRPGVFAQLDVRELGR